VTAAVTGKITAPVGAVLNSRITYGNCLLGRSVVAAWTPVRIALKPPPTQPSARPRCGQGTLQEAADGRASADHVQIGDRQFNKFLGRGIRQFFGRGGRGKYDRGHGRYPFRVNVLVGFVAAKSGDGTKRSVID
jgi:hypothetical protein